ncbi:MULTISPECIES: putative protein N(5)-glutamine methyltransferase [Rhodococcus]|uniref:putative protein N(5)-glutamine methyltransferase n=1 Tax=Rhodococcus TaxID=1827 RepID=UPI001E4DB0BB|nr:MULTISPECIES: putative protein N(5)-glutamine methyltransferase [Rhodococcus]BDB58292.1 N5-glutamine S-adenosyl-L-methionine-dependent methyltransferase [Rhodococcus sp. RDE2]
MVSAPRTHADVVSALRAAGCVFAEEEAQLLVEAAPTPSDLERLIARRVGGEPLEHVLGQVFFHGRRIAVREGVFVPRRRTEYLVDCAIELAQPGAVIVDMCCGCGAVGAALATAIEACEVYAGDIDPVATACARLNLPPHRVFDGDLFDALPGTLRGRVDVLVANAPYVPSGSIGSMPREARCSEPRHALDGGPDGLDVHRRLVAGAGRWLTDGGSLLVESAASQAPVVRDLMTRAGLDADTRGSEEADATVVIGTRR